MTSLALAPKLLLRDVARRWAVELKRAPGRVLVFSPYITSTTAETVLAGVEPKCEVYTCFRAELFAFGSSSLRTMRAMLERGCSLYDLPRLHAKMIIAPGAFATLGSQNLTAQGRRSREATVLLADKIAVDRALRGAQKWLHDAVPITSQMIADMEAKIGPIVRAMRKVRSEAHLADVDVHSRERKRNDARARRRRERLERAARRRLQRLQAAVQQLPRASAVKEAVVGLAGTGHTQRFSLLAPPGADLTSWLVGGRHHQLDRLERYVCLDVDRGRFVWARVGRSRVTFVAEGFSPRDSVFLAGEPVKLHFQAEWGSESAANLRIEAKGRQAAVRIESHFGPQTATILRAAAKDKRSASRKVRAWIVAHEPAFWREAVPLLLAPFKYKTAKHGAEANKFFGNVGARWRLQLALWGEWKLLLVKRQVH